LESDYNDEVLNAKGPVLVHVDAWYDTASQVMEPILEIIAKEYEGKVKFIRLDYDTNIELAYRLGTYSNSLIIIYVKGKERKRFLGAASQKAVTRMIDSVLNSPGDRRSQSK
jgi:thioredoxin 1